MSNYNLWQNKTVSFEFKDGMVLKKSFLKLKAFNLEQKKVFQFKERCVVEL